MKLKLSPMIKSILSLLGVFVFGFGAMNLFWFFSEQTSSLYGLYDYKAATFGDGICLPLLIASLVYYIAINRPIKSRQKNISIIIGTIFAVLAAGWQAEWLINKNTTLNWTLPKQHFFNAAGWYHAVFFIIMFFLIAMLMTRVWFLRRNSKQPCTQLGEIISYAIIWFSGAGFLYLIALDDLGSKFSYDILLLIILVLSITLAIIFSGSSIKRLSVNCLACILSGTTTSFGIAVLTMSSADINVILAIGGALLSLVFIVYNQSKIKMMMCYVFLIICPMLFLTLSAMSFKGTYAYVNFFLIVAIPAMIALRQKKGGDDFRVKNYKSQLKLGSVSVVLYVFVISGLFQLFDSIVDDIIEVIFLIIIGIIANIIVQRNFENVKITEDYRGKLMVVKGSKEPSNELRKVKAYVYTLCVGIALGILITYTNTLISQIEIDVLKSVTAPLWTISNTILTVALLVILLFAFLFRKLRIYNISKNLKLLIVIVIAILGYGSLIANFIILKPMRIMGFSVVSICVVFMIVGSTIMIFKGFLSNTSKLHGAVPDSLIKSSALIISFGILVVITLSLLSNDISTMTLESVVITLLFLALSNIILPGVLALIVQKKHPKRTKLIPSSPVGGVIQDGFLVWVINVFGGILPILLFIINPGYWSWVVQVSAVVGFMYWFLKYCLKNNMNHLDSRYDEYIKYIEEIENKKPVDQTVLRNQLKALHQHLRFQSSCAFITLLLYSAIPFSIIFFPAWIRSNENVSKVFKKIRDSYIPKRYDEWIEEMKRMKRENEKE